MPAASSAAARAEGRPQVDVRMRTATLGRSWHLLRTREHVWVHGTHSLAPVHTRAFSQLGNCAFRGAVRIRTAACGRPREDAEGTYRAPVSASGRMERNS